MNFNIFSALLSIIPCALSAAALANDSAIPMIPVDSIDTNTKVDSFMKFKGAEAAKLMKILPGILTAGGPANDPHSRGLLILSPGYNLTLTCSDNDYSSTSHALRQGKTECIVSFSKKSPGYNVMLFCSDIDYSSNLPGPRYGKPACTVSFGKNPFEGDAFPFVPQSQCVVGE
jgi:hypothetical protein